MWFLDFSPFSSVGPWVSSLAEKLVLNTAVETYKRQSLDPLLETNLEGPELSVGTVL